MTKCRTYVTNLDPTMAPKDVRQDGIYFSVPTWLVKSPLFVWCDMARSHRWFWRLLGVRYLPGRVDA